MALLTTKLPKERVMEEEIEEISPSSSSLGTLPDVVLQHLIPFLKWTSLRSLSQLNSRFRGHYSALLKEGRCLSIKGQISVGVGRDKQIENSFLLEFYTIRVEMDEDFVVEWTLKVESGVRTVVHTHYDGEMRRERTQSVMVSSRDYLERKVKWILGKIQFRKIHLGVPGLAHLFDAYPYKIQDLGVSDEVEYLKLAERLQPKKLTLFQPNQRSSKRGVLNLKKFQNLEELRLFGIPLDLDQLVESRIVRVHADTIEDNVKLKHAKKIIQNWASGHLAYKQIQISCEPHRIPIRVPYNIWSELREHDLEEYFDNIENPQKKIGSFRYSSRSFEFVSWEENGGKEPNYRFLC